MHNFIIIEFNYPPEKPFAQEKYEDKKVGRGWWGREGKCSVVKRKKRNDWQDKPKT